MPTIFLTSFSNHLPFTILKHQPASLHYLETRACFFFYHKNTTNCSCLRDFGLTLGLKPFAFRSLHGRIFLENQFSVQISPSLKSLTLLLSLNQGTIRVPADQFQSYSTVFLFFSKALCNIQIYLICLGIDPPVHMFVRSIYLKSCLSRLHQFPKTQTNF